jgi:hypothetical protein
VAVQEVVHAVSAWIPETDMHGFRSELEVVANKIADSWSLVQMLEELVRPSFKRGNRHVWQPLPTQGATGPADTNAAAAQQKNAKNRSKQDATSHTLQADAAVAISVWPFFLHVGTERGDEAHVFHCFGLTASQTAEAEEKFLLWAHKSQRVSQGPLDPPKKEETRASLYSERFSTGLTPPET